MASKGIRVLYKDGAYDEYPTANWWDWDSWVLIIRRETIKEKLVTTITKSKNILGKVTTVEHNKDTTSTSFENIAMLRSDLVIGVERIE